MVKNPKISFIIVNFNGKKMLEECFASLKKLDYPKDKLEFIVVDNGSSDGSIEFLAKKLPEVKVIKNETNEGFAKPNNDAAKIATGDYIALINNDMKLEANWLTNMLDTLESTNDDRYVCVGSKILNWDGSKIDFIGGGINYYGFGYQDDYAIDVKTADAKYKEDKDILFACGGAMLIDREVYLKVGGLDEDYFAYYEDADLGWRLWIMGYKVRLCVSAACYHRHNSTSKSFNTHKKNLLFERNALYTVIKNYSNENSKVILASLLMAASRLQNDLKIDKDIFDIKSNKNEKLTVNIDENNFTTLVAINEVIDNIDSLIAKREFIQKNRKVDDKELAELYSTPYVNLPLKYLHDVNYLEKSQKLISLLNIDEIYKKPFRRKILLISNDNVGKKMAGPGIRYWEFAKELSKDNDVLLAVPNKVNIDSSKYGIELIEYEPLNPWAVAVAAEQSDIIIIQGTILERSPDLRRICKNKILIVDIYDPFVIENIEVYKHRSKEFRDADFTNSLLVQNDQLERGDYFICASENQMNMWIGMLTALNRVTPEEYDRASDLSKLIGIVPFGISEEKPVKTRSAMREKVPNFKQDDKIFIWGGGVWNWFDPLTLIKAIYEVSKERNDIKLFFMGVKHPNPAVPEMEMTNKAIKLAEELGVKNKYVFFNMDWVDYEDRQNFLLEAYGGVSCHFKNLETRFSFRTRILDYLWAELPIITTEGDFFADEVEKHELGIVVGVENVEDMKNALIKLSDDSALYEICKKNIGIYRESYKWSKVTEPLKAFCKAPVKKDLIESHRLIIDTYQTHRDAVVGEILEGTVIKQTFKCRYPNLSRIEFMIATFNRVNPHELVFKLFERDTNLLIFEKRLQAATLMDNSWVEINFDPIINSEGRSLYFTIEAVNTDDNNAITIWKGDNHIAHCGLFVNDMSINGNLCFKAKATYSDSELEYGYMLPMSEAQLINEDLDIDDIEKIVGNIKDRFKNSDGFNKHSINYDEIENLRANINNINQWISNFDRKLQKVKKITFYDKLKKLIRR